MTTFRLYFHMVSVKPTNKKKQKTKNKKGKVKLNNGWGFKYDH